jgi:putative transposase
MITKIGASLLRRTKTARFFTPDRGFDGASPPRCSHEKERPHAWPDTCVRLPDRHSSQDRRMLLRNDVLEYSLPTPESVGKLRTVRILWIDDCQAIAWTIALHARSAQPEMVALRTLVEDVLAHRARLLLIDPYAAAPAAAALPEKYLQVRARGWEVVSALAKVEPAIYQPRQRGEMVRQYSARHGISHPTIYRYLRRYWERGQTFDALLPDYANSGGRGKTRGASVGVKRGRPRKSAAHPGLNADPGIRATFRAAVARYAATTPGFRGARPTAR